jgi:spore coat polysaccharide biosynthesis protein SpsF
MREAHHDPIAREHVTGYFKLHPDFAPIARASAYPRLAREAGRLTVDTPDDLAFVEALHERLRARAGEASLADLLLLLEREPGLRAINRHVKQKQLRPSSSLAMIRCDGGGKFGYGHVKRMVALARALRDREGVGVLFALHGSEDAAIPMRHAGFEVAMVEDRGALSSLIAARKPDMLVLDGRENPSRREVDILRKSVGIIAMVDDGSDARLACDFAYYPPVPQACALNWTGARTLVRIGWRWALLGLNPHFTPVRAPATPWQTLLVAMGGSDPQGLTLRAAQALLPLELDVRVRFVIGAGMENAAGVAQVIAGLKSNFETVEGADDLAVAYASADLALCAFGVTAYELAAFGVPALYLGLTEDHVRSAGAFQDGGMGLSLGLAAAVTNDSMFAQVKALLNDPIQRLDMRRAGLATLDGGGASRIAADLAQALRDAMPWRAAR